MNRSGNPESRIYTSTPYRRDQRGIAPIVFIVSALAVILATAGVAAYVFIDSTSHPND
ncbi:MAG: hypothetical protein O2783_00920 [Chloroflexi bacterium]|nr:hypothetical protein [Chloroflexota bacterium]